MPEQQTPTDRKIFWLYARIAMVVVLGFLLYALLGHGVSSEQKQRIAKLRERVEALHSGGTAALSPANGTVSTDAATSTSQARAAAQARCDQLCQEIFGNFKIVSMNTLFNKEQVLKLLPKARELVAFYDQHISLSDRARISLSKQDTVELTRFLASSLMKESGYMTVYINGQLRAVARPDSQDDLTPDQIVAAVIPGAKFLRVMGMPNDSNPVANAFQLMFDPDPNNANAKISPIASSLQSLDLNLISPQEPWIWQKQIPYHVEIASTGAADLAQRLSTFMGTYDYVKAGPNEFTHFLSAVTYMPFRQRDVEWRLQFSENLASRSGEIATYQDLFAPGRSVNYGGLNIGMNTQGQARARLACAAIEMLRGAPAPAEVNPASNFYDIYTGGRVQIEKTPIQNGNVRVKLITNCAPGYKNALWASIEFTFVVPVNHPSLNGLK